MAFNINDYVPLFDRCGVYNIYFSEDDGDGSCGTSCTQYFAEDSKDLGECWKMFCKDNDFNLNCIDSVELIQSDLSIFEEFLDETGASVYTTSQWVVTFDCEDHSFESWESMIRFMHEYNESN
jgi:hypothetical protein